MSTAIAVVKNPRAPHQLERCGAFVEGLRRHGWIARVTDSLETADLLVIWGVRRRDLIARQRAGGGAVCVLEAGYLGDRLEWSSVSFGGGLNGRAEFRGPLHDPSRFQRCFAHLLRPWAPPADGYALVMGQVPGDQSLAGVEIEAWYRTTAQALRRQGWADVRFRPHPLAGRRTGAHGMRIIGGDLARALAGAALVVTWNSNSGVIAALAGRPVIAMDEGSMAWPVAGHQLSEIVTPDRTEWASALAWKQWRLDELASGACWETVGCAAPAA